MVVGSVVWWADRILPAARTAEDAPAEPVAERDALAEAG
jgi:hypothetical protein